MSFRGLMIVDRFIMLSVLYRDYGWNVATLLVPMCLHGILDALFVHVHCPVNINPST